MSALMWTQERIERAAAIVTVAESYHGAGLPIEIGRDGAELLALARLALRILDLTTDDLAQRET